MFVDADADGEQDVGENHTLSTGAGYVVARPARALFPLRVLPFILGQSDCIDNVFGDTLQLPLETTLNAGVASVLTSVATRLVSGHALDAREAGRLACRAFLPCVPCSTLLAGDADDAAACNATSGCGLSCEDDGLLLDAFEFGALDALMGPPYNPRWLGWVVAQANVQEAVVCARDSLVCAGPTLCDNMCATYCPTGTASHTQLDVVHALWATLADMAVEGEVPLHDAGGAAIRELMERTATRLSTGLIAGYETRATNCAGTNHAVYNAMILSQATAAAASFPMPASSGPVPGHDLERQRAAAKAALAAVLLAGCQAVRQNCSRPVIGCADERSSRFDPTVTLHDRRSCGNAL